MKGKSENQTDHAENNNLHLPTSSPCVFPNSSAALLVLEMYLWTKSTDISQTTKKVKRDRCSYVQEESVFKILENISPMQLVMHLG